MYPQVDAAQQAGKITADEAAKFKADNAPNATAEIACECKTCTKVIAAL